MRRIESSYDCIFRVSLRPEDGDLVIRDEDRWDVRKGGVSVTEEIDKWEAELSRLFMQ